MTKIVYYGPKDVRLEDAEKAPVCEEGGLLVKVEAVAVCGSDIKAYNIGNPKVVPPRTVGHEFVGRIEESRADGFTKGDRVTMATTIGCGNCYYCKKGKPNICPGAKAMGFYYDGAMADYTAIPALAVKNGNVIKADEDIPAPVAAVAEPMSCVMNGLSRIPVEKLDCALVIGLGALGMFHAIALRDAGVCNIVCCNSRGAKFTLGEKFGFTMVTPGELKKKYRELSDGLGFDLTVITAPDQTVQEEAPGYARKGGYVSYFASLPVANEKLIMSSRMLHYNELVYFGTSDSTSLHVQKALSLLSAQRTMVEEFITVLPLDRYLDGYLGVMERRYAKVVLIPGA
jgi:L-iditol 2-dehydrogenase